MTCICFSSGSISLSYVSPRATTSDETSGGASQFVDVKRDSVIILEDSETADKNAYNGMVATEETKEESPVDELVQPFDFAEKLNVKVIFNYTFSFLFDISKSWHIYTH